MTRSSLRWLPGITVAALLALALVAPRRGLGARSTPVAGYFYYPVCSVIAEGGNGSGTQQSLPEGEGVNQRLGVLENFATCSLTVQSATYSASRFDVVFWDAGTLAPVASTIALRTLSFPATYYAYNRSRVDLFPPVITRALANVAEPPPAETAMEFRVTSGATQSVTYVPNDPSGAQAGLRIPPGSARQPMAGAHPVLSHSICGGDEGLRALRLVQSVMTTNALLDISSDEFIQKFRVPVTTTARWVELAFASTPIWQTIDFGRIRIVDAQGQATPPVTFGTPLADAQFKTYGSNPATWESHYDFASLPTLQANHDYWLVVTTSHDYSLYARALTGGENFYFKSAIGGLYRRLTFGASAALVPDRAMSFRLIGEPVTTVGVTSLAPARARLSLEVAPNPARGATVVTWSGASEGVRFEVLDARGRRVASGVPDSGAQGRWTWNGAGDDGQGLPAGLYFVHVRDAAGHGATARVSLVR